MKSKIGEIIDSQGYKKKYIAERMDITQSQLSNWISGRSYPPMDKAFKLAKFLNVKVDDLYEEIEK
ncbi:helix-turn-helix domain-containing protein [Priestia megaterium]|uniref:helix-turn-helix domain-containing protein n=1 Tax=Priestia megaterium TaxID=1404 RepID=UPI000BF50A8D|nr:helix-turn-helix transcriptional regulator [Priestia megaterium]PFK01984.1 transcriptional regulator [Priestia megaterium]PGR01361.1 transcriptional regulator [Priestia megaterium]PMD08149.1 XRE family transcriptional regulator [Priestia megaterium]